MPEIGIGLFPDVGGGWYLPRLPHRAGLWLALTGARLRAADCLSLGLATHHVPSGALERLKAAVMTDSEGLEALLADFARPAGAAALDEHLDVVEQAFGAARLEDVMATLADGQEWARAQAAVLATRSPQSLKAAWRQMRIGARLNDFADEMRMEFRLASRIVRTADFLEGVRAVVIDKDNAPHWRPPHLAEVSDSDLDALFAPLPDEQEWRPLP
jgi:enoyl-CoA hydratase